MLGFGSGWSQDVAHGLQLTGPLGKCSSDTADLPEGSSKQQRREFVVDNDMVTEPETDDDVGPQCPHLGLQAPPPSHEAALAMAPDSWPSATSSHSLGGSLPYSPLPGIAQDGTSPSPLAGHPSLFSQQHPTEKPRFP
ncbi:hypothetical protein OPQ81_000003 [Rhizoctonia solani]|nr:hypothetical protein OPQ81_000003 [Rhizoctonia solani]